MPLQRALLLIITEPHPSVFSLYLSVGEKPQLYSKTHAFVLSRGLLETQMSITNQRLTPPLSPLVRLTFRPRETQCKVSESNTTRYPAVHQNLEKTLDVCIDKNILMVDVFRALLVSMISSTTPRCKVFPQNGERWRTAAGYGSNKIFSRGTLPYSSVGFSRFLV